MLKLSATSNPLYGENYPHITDRDDWDNLNFELYREVIESWPSNGLALLSNSREGNTHLRRPHLRMGRDVDGAVRDMIERFTNDHLVEIFRRAADKMPDVSDCYVVRNLGLPNNALVYLVEHRKGGHRTLLVFGGARLRGRLESRCARIADILGREARRPGQREAELQGMGPQGPPEPLSTLKSVTTASDAALNAREFYLNRQRDDLRYSQRVELERIQTELRRRAER